MFQDRTEARVRRETNVTVNILKTEIRQSKPGAIFGREDHAITHLEGSLIGDTVLAFDSSGGQLVRFRRRLIVDRTISLAAKKVNYRSNEIKPRADLRGTRLVD